MSRRPRGAGRQLRSWEQLALDVADDNRREFERQRRIAREQEGRDE